MFEDEQTDEFASYFDRSRTPKVLVTTTVNPSRDLVKFVKELRVIVGWNECEYRKRTPETIKQIINGAIERDYTDFAVVSEHADKPRMLHFYSRSVGSRYHMLMAIIIDTLTLVHLPNGPTAQFRITNLVMRKFIPVCNYDLCLVRKYLLTLRIGTWKTNRPYSRTHIE